MFSTKKKLHSSGNENMHLIIKCKSDSNIYKKIFWSGNAPKSTRDWRDDFFCSHTRAEALLLAKNHPSHVTKITKQGSGAAKQGGDKQNQVSGGVGVSHHGHANADSTGGRERNQRGSDGGL